MSAFYSVYIQDTVRYIVRMFPGFVLAGALFWGTRRRRARRLAELGVGSSRLREGTLLLFCLFAGGMAVLTLTPYWFDWWPLVRGLRIAGPFFSLGGRNLRLGVCFSGGLWQSYMLLGNIVMFLPFGFFAALLWRGYTWRRALVTGLCVTGFIECWQLCVGRAFDIDDIWLNTLGVLCGYGLWRLVKRAAPGFAEKFHVYIDNEETR